MLKSNCMRPPHPKGWGMLRAARLHARFYGIQKSSIFRYLDPLIRIIVTLFSVPRESLLIKIKSKKI